MGLKMRFNLFYQVPHEAVYESIAQFYSRAGKHLLNSGEEHFRYDLHKLDAEWVTLQLGGGWYWKEWQEAQVFTSQILNCTNFLFFVYDGDYWGYQLCSHGKVLDQFIQRDETSDGTVWFPGEPATGNPELLATKFSWLKAERIAPYLQKLPPYGLAGDYMAEEKRLNIRVQPQDEFCRFDECSILNFLRLLHVSVQLCDVTEGGYTFSGVTFLSPLWKSFWVEGRRSFEDVRDPAKSKALDEYLRDPKRWPKGIVPTE